MSGLVVSLWLLGSTLLALVQPVVGPLLYYLIVWMHPEQQMYGGLDLRWTLIIAVTSLFGYLSLGKQRQFPKNSLVFFLILFSLWYFASAFINNVDDREFTLATDFAKIILMSLLTASIMNTRARLHILTWIIVIAIGSVSMRTGLITILSGGGSVVVGPKFLGHTNEYGRFVIYTWPLMVYLARQSALPYVRMGFAALAGLSVFALIGTNSRGAFVAFAAMCAVLWYYGNKKIISVVLIGAFAVAAVFILPPDRLESFTSRASSIENADKDTSFMARTESWTFGWNYALNHPVFGGGPNTFERVHKVASHSSYFEVLGETGFVGLAIWSVMGILAFTTIFRIRRLTKGIADLAWADDLAFFIMISLVGYFVGGLAKNHGLNEYYYMLLGILMGLETAVINYLVSRSSVALDHTSALGKNAVAQN